MRRDSRTAPSWQEPTKREAIEVQLQLITPMFGGGYKTREVDPLMPIRPAAIRGHLRFWWRATAGAQYTNAGELYKAETAIWGGAAVKDEAAVGKVAIQTEMINEGNEAPYARVAPKATPREGPLHGYFLFPFQAQQDGTPAAVGRENVSFRVRVLLDSSLSEAQKREVQNALKAWIAFGGVGARTRRGCGALRATGSSANEWLPPASPEQLGAWLRQLLPNQVVKQPAVLPSLQGARLGFVQNIGDATAVWRELGRFWARFRKGHFKEAYQPMKGAKWRDYRQVLCHLKQQGDTLRLAKPFLGLPIIYQEIRGARNLCFVGTLEPVNSGRMASPVILKPVALARGGTVGLILILNAKRPERITVNKRQYRLSLPDKNEPVLKDLQVSDVLEAVNAAAALHFSGKFKSFAIGGEV